MNFIKHIQFQQFVNLLLILIIAKNNHTLIASWQTVTALALFSAFFELLLVNIKQRSKTIYLPYSAIITSFGIILMIGWLKWYIPYILVSLALLQKKLLLIENRHIFNPSNFAVIIALGLFYPKALPIVGQIGYQGYLPVIVTLILAIFILYRVNRLTISLLFAFFYTILEYFIIAHSNPTWEFTHFLTKFYSTSFIVYIFFMLTDPATTPNSVLKQAIFAFLVALIAVLFDFYLGIKVQNLFSALFLTSLLFAPFYNNLTKEDWIKYSIILLFSIAVLIVIYTHKTLYFSAS